MKRISFRMFSMLLIVLLLSVVVFLPMTVRAAALAMSPPMITAATTPQAGATDLNIQFTPEVIAGIVGLVLTLVFAYFPKLRVLYGGLQSEVKSLIMLVLLLITALVIMLLSKYGIIVTSEPVTWLLFVKVMFAALVANQPAYTLLPQTADVKAAKLAR